MTITDWIQALSTIALVIVTWFYVRKINEGNKTTKLMAVATKELAEETKKMANAVQSQRRQESIKGAILTALLGNDKSAEQIANETQFTLEEIIPVIAGLMGPMGLLQDYGKNPKGERVYRCRSHIKAY